ncbi:MAG: ABC-type transport auxiliary lipoprotein family protein [Desulfobacca sp.]|uniref:ABC-type transport auxiliary lipoprotein family protein n=1 Tax=Desulfobacca sp. TaxID=2067990 RepID=UPI00404B8103
MKTGNRQRAKFESANLGEDRESGSLGLLTVLMVLVAGMTLLGGCGKPPLVTNHFLLDYPVPIVGKKTALPESIRVELFAAAQAINSTNMVYRPSPYQSAAYAYNRWQVSPAYLVTDFLLRDLRQSHLFAGVFGYQQSGIGRFRLEGAVQEFAEVNDPSGWQAVLAVSITLSDLNEAEVTQRVILQQNYRQIHPMLEKTPAGLAQAMSQAMAAVSAEILADGYQAAARRLGR